MNINVNLAECDCPTDRARLKGGGHFDTCAARPIPIPCPFPRSVTFTLKTSGRCDGCATWAVAAAPYGKAPDGSHHAHHDRCPARPIRVSCSISGSTWEESEVSDMDVPGAVARHGSISATRELCRERWALVKALVLGERVLPVMAIGWDANDRLLAQRDAVFAALAEVARVEEEQAKAYSRAIAAIGPIKAMTGSGERPSVFVLAACVERLIEQVSNLP